MKCYEMSISLYEPNGNLLGDGRRNGTETLDISSRTSLRLSITPALSEEEGDE